MSEIDLWEISFMTINDRYNLFSFANHKQLVARFSKNNVSYLSVLSCSYALERESRSMLSVIMFNVIMLSVIMLSVVAAISSS
jgi:hypothetical protein